MMSDRCRGVVHDLSHPSGECDDGAVPATFALPSRLRAIAAIFLACVFTLAVPSALFAAGSDSGVEPQDDTEVTDDTVYYYDLEKDPSECVGFLPKPGCGKKPEDAGERGGALQYTTFAVMLGGIGVIAAVIIRNVIQRDRMMNAPHDTSSTPEEPKNTSDN